MFSTTKLMLTGAIDPDAQAYKSATGISDAQALVVESWIKGLKAIGAWNSARMWIPMTTYNGPSATILYGLGGAGPINATLVSGTGSITRSANEFLFQGTGANAIISGTNLLPVAPLGSYLFVERFPAFYTHYGAGFGGERGYIGFTKYAGYQLSDAAAGTILNFNGPVRIGIGALISPAPIANLLIVSGEQLGASYSNGGSRLAATAGGANYTSFARSPNTIVAGNPNFATPGDSATSFVCMWTTDQSANATAIYNLYKSTIGSGLSLP